LLSFLDLTGFEEHVDEHVQQSRWISIRWFMRPNRIPINTPFVEDGEDKIAEYGLEEDHSWDEIAPYIDG